MVKAPNGAAKRRIITIPRGNSPPARLI